MHDQGAVATVISEPDSGRLPLQAQLHAALAARRASAAESPFVNPIQMLARDLAGRLDSGEVSLAELGRVIDALTREAFDARARQLGRYVGETDPEANRARLRACLHGLAHRDGARLPFAAFAAEVQRERLGLVITAHPTFGTAAALSRTLAALAAGRTDLPPTELAAVRHGPDEPITLAHEIGQSVEAVLAIQDALRVLYQELFALAETLYPADWQALTPRLVTVASWVGFDLDGRGDIAWTDTFRARLRLQAIQLERYAACLAAVAGRLPADGTGGAAAPMALTLARSRLELALTICRSDLLHLPEDARDADQLQGFVVHLRRTRDSRLTSLAPVIAGLDQALAALAAAPEVARDLLVLRAEMANYGLGAAHIHVRLNASQLHNAIRHRINLERTPDQAATRRRFLTALNEELEEVKQPVTVNFPTLAAEPTTAKRLFMLIVQMLKYIDAVTPVRFLIAEAGTSFTILTAVFYARLFGVEDRVDISPLFETDAALERGPAIIGELLHHAQFRAYVERRGRLCLQTGYSDAGRFLGQVPAAMAIERLRMKLARVLADEGLGHLELVIFDTQGESIGRGGHPGSLLDRFLYLSSPESRALFADRGLRFKQEVSFQGGDGYVFFADPRLALATVTCLFQAIMTPPPPAGHDPIYLDTDYSLDFFLGVKEANRLLMDDKAYAALLSAFGTNLLHATGSRVARRHHDVKAGADMEHPSQLRAIPHNGTLQQLGYLANALYGVGTAAVLDLERFLSLVQTSDRFRRLMGIVDQAERLSSLHVLAAYLSVLDPGAWLAQLATERDPARSRRIHRLIRHLESRGRHVRVQAGYRRLAFDGLDLRTALHAAAPGRTTPEPRRDALDLLHAIRIALIEQVFILAMRIPRFTSQPDVTAEEILDEILSLAIPPALQVLDRAFPRDGETGAAQETEEPASYRLDRSQGYAQEHEEIFGPLGELYGLIRRITTPVSYLCGATG